MNPDALTGDVLLPAACNFDEPTEEHAVHVHHSAAWSYLVGHIEQFLTESGRQQMHEEIGEAVVGSLGSGTDTEVNGVIEAWLRTLRLKQAGIDAKLDEPDPDEEPASLDEWRQRLAG